MRTRRLSRSKARTGGTKMRKVQDHFRGMTNKAIKQELASWPIGAAK